MADRVAQICAERGVRFTPLRRVAFEALLAFNGPAGAYDLIRALQLRLGKHVAPPTAYRALEFLQEQGFVTWIETRNAFLPSSHPEDRNLGAFLLRDHCGATVEVEFPELDAEFACWAKALGFRVGRRVVELQGTCAECQGESAPPEKGRA
ncbi:Fur family transcriptional regulator [Paenirhodobacter sp.]|uniref:Fur family transcriptional regulator n=1 Tax=Paenirhodobacter sp. TaxID=1965326 RepID=UPI003B3E3C9C